MKRVLVFLGIASSLLGCASAPVLENVVVGTRRGQEDAVDRAHEVAAGTRKDLAATVEVRGNAGWVHATWTVWPRSGPRVVYSKAFNTTGPTKLFVSAPGDTLSGGWEEGSVTCEFKTAGGGLAGGVIRVVAR